MSPRVGAGIRPPERSSGGMRHSLLEIMARRNLMAVSVFLPEHDLNGRHLVLGR
jgi:hypothetical protein